MAPFTGSFDLVCANLPYVAADADLAPEVVAQPARSLFAGQNGSALVTRLLHELPARLNPGGRALTEIDPSIASLAIDAANRGFAGHRIHCDLSGHQRVLEAWSSIPTNSEPSA
jgi:release factor glutamine methyltransferase